MMEAPDTARLTAPMSPLPPMPPPVLVGIWIASDIQENSPASDTIDSPRLERELEHRHRRSVDRLFHA